LKDNNPNRLWSRYHLILIGILLAILYWIIQRFS